ncbi:hypothetical protein LQZ18_14895 [Lachnospiraceae bacterium ZAX-1]
MFKRMNDILPELLVIIIVYGILVQFIGVWFVEDKLRYSTGLWIGIAIALAMAIHMAAIVLDAVDTMAEKPAKVKSITHSVIRYVLAVGIFIIVNQFHLGNLVTTFLGVMGLKVAAYLYPFTHKGRMKYKGRGDKPADKK